MNLTCDACAEPIKWNDHVCPLKGAFKNRWMVTGNHTKQIEYYWKQCRFDATYWCLECWKADSERKAARDGYELLYKREFDLMKEWGMVSQKKVQRMEAYDPCKRK